MVEAQKQMIWSTKQPTERQKLTEKLATMGADFAKRWLTDRPTDSQRLHPYDHRAGCGCHFCMDASAIMRVVRELEALR